MYVSSCQDLYLGRSNAAHHLSLDRNIDSQGHYRDASRNAIHLRTWHAQSAQERSLGLSDEDFGYGKADR